MFSNHHKHSNNKGRCRSAKGQSVPEFGASTVVLICLVLIPLVNLSVIPVRYFLSQGVLSELTNRLSQSEKRSAAYATMANDTRWVQTLGSFGSALTSARLDMIATSSDGTKKLTINEGQAIPVDWLPGGKNSPCIYSLRLRCDLAISPLFGGSGGVPGLNAPVKLSIANSSNWSNLSRDPKSQSLSFFIDE